MSVKLRLHTTAFRQIVFYTRSKCVYSSCIVFFIFSSICQASNPTDGSQQMVSLVKSSITDSTSTKKCYVWFETNTIHHLSQYIDNIEPWLTIGEPIVTARKDNILEFIDVLKNAGINPIAGFKTSDFFRNVPYDNQDAWGKVALLANQVSEKTNGNPVILENEGALRLHDKNNNNKISLSKLINTISIQTWPSIWLWHAPTKSDHELHSISYAVAEGIMHNNHSSHLIEHYSVGYSSSIYDTRSKQALSITLKLDPSPIPIIYLDDKIKNFWRYSELENPIEHSDASTIILYPGFNDLANKNSLSENRILQCATKHIIN